MARTTKEQASRTREKLIETAIDVFYERGVNATTLEQVAEAAGLTRGALYWHFENKLALVSAVHEHFHIKVLSMISDDISSLNTPPLTRMRNALNRFLHNIATDVLSRKTMTIFMLKCDYSGELASLLTQQLARKAEARQMLQAKYEEALEKGHLRPVYTAEQLVQAHMCFMHGVLYEHIAHNKTERLLDDGERLMDFYFSTLPTP